MDRGIDGSELAAWAARNAEGPDLSVDGAMTSTRARRLTDDGPFLSLDARARSVEESHLSVTVSWYDENEELGPA